MKTVCIGLRDCCQGHGILLGSGIDTDDAHIVVKRFGPAEILQGANKALNAFMRGTRCQVLEGIGECEGFEISVRTPVDLDGFNKPVRIEQDFPV